MLIGPGKMDLNGSVINKLPDSICNINKNAARDP